MKFTIPGAPCGKGRPRFSRQGQFVRTYTPAKTVNYESLVVLEFQSAYPDFRPYEKGVPLAMNITANFTPPKSVSRKKRYEMLEGLEYPTKLPDSDNIAKIIMDALHGVCYLNDCSVVQLNVIKRYSDVPSVSVEILEIDGANTPK